MRTMALAVCATLVCVLVHSAESVRIEVDKIEGVVEVQPLSYSINRDLNMMVQSYPHDQYTSATFFKEVVKTKYEEKKKEITAATTILKTDRLFENSTIEGVKGCGFSLRGDVKEGGTFVIEYYWIELGDEVVKVMIMGNGKTYEANVNKLHQFLRSIRIG